MLIGYAAPEFYLNADRSREYMIDELRKWRRVEIVEDVEKADIVIHLYAWDEQATIGSRPHIGTKLVALVGPNANNAGAPIWCVHEVLWGRQYARTRHVAEEAR